MENEFSFFNVRIERGTFEKLKALAKSQSRTIAGQVRKYIIEGLAREKEEADADGGKIGGEK